MIFPYLKNSILIAPLTLLLFSGVFAAIEHKEEIRMQNHSSSLWNEALALRNRGDFAPSIKKYLELLSPEQQVSDEIKQDVLIQLATLNWNIGDMQLSNSYFEKALALATATGDRDHVLYCTEAINIFTLYNKAKEKRSQEKFDESISLFNEAIAIARRINSKEHELKCLRQMSSNYWNTGQIKIFYDKNLEALEISKAIHHQGEQGVCNNNIGLYYWKCSDYSNAIKHFQIALDIADKNHLEYDKSDCMTNLGLVYLEFGDYDNAKDYILGAMEVDSNANDTFNLAIDYNNYGMIQKNIGISSKNVEHIYASIESYKKSYFFAKNKSNKYIQCISCANMGEAYSSLKQYLKAISYFSEALSIAKEIGNKDIESQIDNNLGNSYLGLAQYEVAIAFYYEAIYLAVAGQNTNQLWEAYFGLGQCFEAQNSYSDALNFYVKSIDAVDSIRSKILLETYKIGFSRNKLHVYERLIHLLWEDASVRDPRHDENDIFNHIEKFKARAFLECLAESSIDVLGHIEEPKKKEILDSSSRVSALSFEMTRQAGSSARRPDIKKELAREEENYFRLNSSLRMDNPELASLVAPRPATLFEVQKSLADEKTAVVEFFLGDRRSYLIYISRNAIRIHPLSSREEIEKSVSPFIKLISSPRNSEIDRKKAGKRIFHELFSAIAWDQQQTIQSIIIIPDGILNFLPFEALVYEEIDQPDQYLLKRFCISYAPSASIMILLNELKPKMQSFKGLLALGNPDYSGARENVRSSLGIKTGAYYKLANSFAPLPFSKEEIEAISLFFPQNQRKVFLGDQAREDILKSHSQSAYQIIHLACHGIIDVDLPYRSSLIFSQNHNINEDGILHVWELYNLRFNANLVILSACETGSGALDKSEGVLGLTRIFFYTGARSILSTLWSINDKSTVFFMKSFYRYLSAGRTKAQALREAKIEMLGSSYFHPYYWAGFVLSGEASSKVSFDN
jgi:CHAT domain-containing protein/Tfp pilus assembly protein PilF